jgi:lysophospholipase L1-like esterase
VTKRLRAALSVLAVLLMTALGTELLALGYLEYMAPRFYPPPPARHHVALLGDCVTYNLCPRLRAALGSDYVISQYGHGLTSANLASSLDWLRYKKADVIYFNVGLVDFMRDRRTVDAFKDNLDKFLCALDGQGHGVVLLWGTITPVGEGATLPPQAGPTWVPPREEDVERFNAAAIEVMKKHGVEIVEMRAVFDKSLEYMLMRDRYHPNHAALERMAQAVAVQVRSLASHNP